MSDLAPFVAAVLRDKSNADMKQENDTQRQEIDSLRQQLRDTRAVKITGANGSPVYARSQLEDGFVCANNFGLYFVEFPYQQKLEQLQQGLLAFCSPRDLRNLEVHIGGLRIELIRGRYDRVRDYNRADQCGDWLFSGSGSSRVQAVGIVIGPFTTEAECNAFDPNLSVPNNTNSNGKPLAVRFAGVSFDTSAISGLIDNFEQHRQQAQAAASAAADTEDDVDDGDDDADSD